VTDALVRVGQLVSDAIGQTGATALLVGRAAVRAFRPPLQLVNYIYQLLQVGVRSLALTVTMAAFAGMVLAYQFGYGLERFGAKLLIGQVTVISIFRELGPVLTALIVGGRVGAGFAAELGGMAVTEQIDAVRALGADPLERLVAPRLLATTIAMPLLTACADVTATAAAIFIARWQYGVGVRLFLHGVYDFVEIDDFASGLAKSAVFGLVSAAVSCYVGLSARGGTEGVGRAATRAVVASSRAVLAADFLLTVALIRL
jgi:phospholipid/cholesterol/gamma-HCH transport system permease protein